MKRKLLYPAKPSGPDIITCMDDPSLFRAWFKKRSSWVAWRAFLKALFALGMTGSEKAIFQECTKRNDVPLQVFTEAWLVVGRRGGKSFILAVIAVFLACFRNWSAHLAPGERGSVIIIATDRKQARVIFRYVEALLSNVPMLSKMIVRKGRESIELNNSINVEIFTASFRTVRGYTVVAALLDEVAFWRSDESANPDDEILEALRPAMATVPGAVLLGASSPYARKGVLYENWQTSFGKPDDDVLVWQAPTSTMNPRLSKKVIQKAYDKDPSSAAAEYGAQFRSDVETFVSKEVVDAVKVANRHELAPLPGIFYRAFCDPSGGSADSFTLAIGHRGADGVIILDAVRERLAPFSPDAVVDDFAEVLKRYRVSSVLGDRYAGEWPRDAFRKRGVEYNVAAKSKSELYRDLLPVLNSGGIELLDHPRMLAQLLSLERRTARGGKDSIDHPQGGKDDIINSVAGLIAAIGGTTAIELFTGTDSDNESKEMREKILLEAGWHSQ